MVISVRYGQRPLLIVMTLTAAAVALRCRLTRIRMSCSDAFALLGTAHRGLSSTPVALAEARQRSAPSSSSRGERGTSAAALTLSPALLAGALVAKSSRSVKGREGRHAYNVVRRAQSLVSQIDFRVGQIVSCERHPESDKLLVEKIDVGEEAPRQILSGIGKFLTPDDVVGSRVVIVSNLKARKLAGMPSEGMLLCASKTEGEGEDEILSELCLVEAPEGAAVGERVQIEAEDGEIGEPFAPNKVAKKKIFEQVAPDLQTDAEGTVQYKSSNFVTTAGPCTAKAIPSGRVS
mmetsp:Transcript_59017/g.104873  ORF Transcript_59017/g.104873 Transcript_59017/m.104873 type:complete len:292 (+) Transcript_59017:15-890(+)